MVDYFEYENIFLPLRWRSSSFLKVLSYIRNIFITFKHLITKKPKTVWIQLPQTFLLWPVLFYRLFSNVKVIADYQNYFTTSKGLRLLY